MPCRLVDDRRRLTRHRAVWSRLQPARSQVQEPCRPVPLQRAWVHETLHPGEEHFRRPSGLGREWLMPKCEARDRREEHSRIELDRSLPELGPVDDAGTAVHVEDVARVERAVHEARCLLSRRDTNEELRHRFRGSPKHPVGATERPGRHASLVDHVLAAPRRPEPHALPRGVPQPRCCQLSGAGAVPQLDQMVGRRPLQPANDDQPEMAVPGEQTRDAGPEVPSEPEASELPVQLGLGRWIVRIKLDGESAIARARLERHARAHHMVARSNLDSTVGQAEIGQCGGEAQGSDGLEAGQRAIDGKVGGRLPTTGQGGIVGKHGSAQGWIR